MIHRKSFPEARSLKMIEEAPQSCHANIKLANILKTNCLQISHEFSGIPEFSKINYKLSKMSFPYLKTLLKGIFNIFPDRDLCFIDLERLSGYSHSMFS